MEARDDEVKNFALSDERHNYYKIIGARSLRNSASTYRKEKITDFLPLAIFGATFLKRWQTYFYKYCW